jgi:hypothetical protein
LFERVWTKLKKLLPPDIKINQLKKGRFQKYIDQRLSEKNPQSEAFILPETVNKELSAISVALKNAPLYFSELENEVVPEVPKAKMTKRRRERLVGKENELFVLLEYLRSPHIYLKVEAYRRDLADNLEIRYETGLLKRDCEERKSSSSKRRNTSPPKPHCGMSKDGRPAPSRNFFL